MYYIFFLYIFFFKSYKNNVLIGKKILYYVIYIIKQA